MEDLPSVAGTSRRRDREMGFEASVREEQAYAPFLSPSNLFHFIAPLYISTDQLLVFKSLPLLKLGPIFFLVFLLSLEKNKLFSISV